MINRVKMGTSDSNSKPEAHAFSVHHSNARKARGKGDRVMLVLNPHLLPTKRNDRNLTGVAKRREERALKTLEIKIKGFVSAKEESGPGSSREESNRLDKIESLLASLLN
jgi:hypothetical protein